MTAAIKINPNKLPVPLLPATHSCRVDFRPQGFRPSSTTISTFAEIHYNKDGRVRARMGPKGPRIWTPNRVQILSELYLAGKTSPQIADEMGMDQKQIKSQIDRLHKDGLLIKRRSDKGWKDEELQKLVKRYTDGVPLKSISAEMGRTVSAVERKLTELRNTGRLEVRRNSPRTVRSDRGD